MEQILDAKLLKCKKQLFRSVFPFSFCEFVMIVSKFHCWVFCYHERKTKMSYESVMES